MSRNFLTTLLILMSIAITLNANAKELVAANPEAVVREAVEHVGGQRYQKALDLLNTLPKDLTNQAELLHLRSSAYAGLGNLGAMRKDLKSAVAAKPNYLPARFALARLAIATGDLDAARSHRDALQQQINNSGDAQLQALERDLLVAEQTVQAEGQSVPIQINSSEDVAAAASLLLREGDPEAAINLLEAWSTGRPNDLEVRMLLAGVFEQLDRKSDALNAYESVIKHDPLHVAALNNAAWLIREDNPSTAINYSETALAQEPENPSILDTYAVIAHASGKKTEALKAIRLASNLAPGVPAILLHAAKIEMDAGDEAKARKNLEQIITSKEDLAEKPEAQALMRLLER